MISRHFSIKYLVLMCLITACTHSAQDPDRDVAANHPDSNLNCTYIRRMAFIDNGTLCQENKEWKNFGRTLVNKPAVFFEPRNADEVIRIVFQAYQNSWQVRPVGSGHSWSQATKTDDILMSTEKLVQPIQIDPNRLTVTVGGGQKVRELIEVIESRGYSLANLGDAQIQSVAGVVSTNTHGTGVTHQGFAGAVKQLKIVDGQGHLRVASATERPKLFRATRSGAGMMGVITEVTLKIVPAFNIYSETEAVPLSLLMTDWKRLLRQNEWFSFLWILNSDYVTLFTGIKATSSQQPREDNNVAENIRRNFFTPLFASLYAHNRKILHRFVPSVYSMQRGITPIKTDYAVGSDAISKSVNPRHWAWNLETEFFMPIDYLPEYLVRARQYVQLLQRENVIPAAPMIGFRFIKGDNSYLSPAYIYKGHDEFVAISVFDTHPSTQSPYLIAMKGLLDDIVKDKKLLRMHIGKVYLDSPEEFHQRFANWNTFAEIQKHYDPHGVFLNPWTSRFFQ